MFMRERSSKHTQRPYAALFFLCLISLGLLAGCANTPASNAGATRPIPTSPSSIPTVAITAIDYGYIMPETITVQAGLVDFAMVDNGTQPHQTQIARLKPGITQDKVLDELVTRRNQAAAFSLLTFVGGPDIVSPGYGQETILTLSAGRYVLLCLVVGPDGVPHVNKGMIHFFTVAEASAQERGSLPQPDGKVMMTDSGYTLPAIITQARALTLQVTNWGSEPHEMNIVKLAAGKGIQDIASFFQSPSGPPPFEETGGMAALEASGSGWIKIHLEPGNYAVLSFLPDRRTGKPQFTLGMITQFTVR